MTGCLPTAAEQVIIIKQLLQADRLCVGDLAYVISLEWIRKWKTAVGFSGTSPPTEDCPPIDNTDLISDDGKSVRERKMETVDYSVFSPGVWDTLYSWYGGGPAISAEVVYDRVKKRNVALLRLTKLNIVFGRTVTVIQFSKYRLISELKEAVCSLLQIDPSKHGLYKAWDHETGKPLDSGVTLAELFVNDGDTIIVDLIVNPRFSGAADIPRSHQLVRHSKSTVGHLSARYTPGLTGLVNFGNTCFFNSSLQCLLHTMPLVRFFTDGDWRRDLCPNNPLGTKCEIVKEFYSTLCDVWSGNTKSVSPRTFLASLRKQSVDFSGYLQQDAHETLMRLLDYLHEDLNRVKSKPIVDSVTGTGENDEEVAEKSWENHKLRNDSIVSDLFHGQLKSTLVCPKCGRCVSIFDPFVSISVPVPVPEVLSPVFTFVPYDPVQPKVVMQIPVTFGLQVAGFKESLCKKVGREFDCLFAFKDAHGKYEFVESPSKPQLNQTLYVFEVPTTDDVVYCLTNLGVNVTHGFTVKTKSLDDCYLLQLPDEVVEESVMQSLIEQRFEFLWEGELAYDVPSDFISLRKVMKTSNSCNKLDFDKPISFNHELKFSRNKRIPCVSNRIVTAVLNTKFVNSANHFNWARLKRETVSQPRAELEANLPTLESCLENFSKPTVLDEDNQWYCSECKEFVCAEQKTDIWKLPKCMIVHLKRFSSSATGFRKVETNVQCPNELDFSKFVVGPESVEGEKYKLYAVIQHFGQLNGGHYLTNAYCESIEKWESFNDGCVSEVVNDSACKAGAYVLLYMRA